MGAVTRGFGAFLETIRAAADTTGFSGEATSGWSLEDVDRGEGGDGKKEKKKKKKRACVFFFATGWGIREAYVRFRDSEAGHRLGVLVAGYEGFRGVEYAAVRTESAEIPA